MNIRKRNIVFAAAMFMLVRMFAQGPGNSGTYYRQADGKKGSELKTALWSVIKDHTQRSYNQLWEDFKTTDKRSDGKVWDMYSSITNYTFGVDQAGSYKVEGDAYNREHSFPKSWFDDASPMYTDLVHLVPADGYVNGRRSNNPFGETDGDRWQSAGGFSKLGKSTVSGYNGIVFEPNDEYKGDFARIYFYMATCYEDKIAYWNCDMLAGNSYPAYTKWALDMLLRWAEEDPVSQKEIDRNNAVYGIQHNRNPFVDYPGLEQYVWGTMRTCLSAMTTTWNRRVRLCRNLIRIRNQTRTPIQILRLRVPCMRKSRLRTDCLPVVNILLCMSRRARMPQGQWVSRTMI